MWKMNKVRQDNLLSMNLHRFLDILLVFGALAGAYAIKEGFSIGIPTERFTLQTVLMTIGFVSLCWLIVTSALETYVYKRRFFGEIVNLAMALVLTIAFFLSLVYFTRIFVFPRWTIVFWGLLGAGLLILSRAVKQAVAQELHRRGYWVRRVAIVGTTPVAQRLARLYRVEHTLGYHFCGFVITDETPPKGVRQIIGHIKDLPDLLTEHQIHEIVVALPGRDHETVADIACRCQHIHVRLRVVPDLLDVVMSRATFTEVGNIPLIGLRDPVITGYQSWVKRAFDIAVASFSILMFLPLFVVIPLLIRLDSPGRIFFVQRRAGVNGRPFRMFKFRSMIEGADRRLSEMIDLKNLPQPAYKLVDDPRVTPIGRFLRRTSLDELPQLFNVIKGDMSMVGPRPEAMEIVSHYTLKNRRRLSVKPGITGPMQVNGRGDLPFNDRLRMELGYIAKYSLLEDIKYLVRTIPALYHRRGAY
jgi:exopolysaccharide biosynthesis polyprenyl glycosylphosphotransferase